MKRHILAKSEASRRTANDGVVCNGLNVHPTLSIICLHISSSALSFCLDLMSGKNMENCAQPIS